MTEGNNVVVAIAGGTGSGKSSIAEALARVLGDRATTLKQDWYLRPSAERPALPNVHHPDKVDFPSLARDLAALRGGESVLVPNFGEDRGLVGHAGSVLAPRSVIIVEGELILYAEPVRALIEHSIFLDAPADLRLVRRLRREARESGHDAAAVLAQYATIVRPMHDTFVEPQRRFADKVLDASSQDALDRAGVVLAALIRPHLDRADRVQIARA